MTFEIVTVPCLSDNYAFLVKGPEKVALVDAPEAEPIREALEDRGWSLDEIWLTHHHADHVQGVEALKARFNPRIRGAKADIHRLPDLDFSHEDGDTFEFDGAEVRVMDVSGHTVGHIAYYMPDASAAFTADSLMALGCGRVFEGTMEQMWGSLQRIAALPGETMIYSGHEYTQTNARFALTIEPENGPLKERAAAVDIATENGIPTVPSLLADELVTNPFLRAGLPYVKQLLNMGDKSDADVFAEIRRRKDSF